MSPDLRVLPQADGHDEQWLESVESMLQLALKNHDAQKTSRFLDSLLGRLRSQGFEAPRVVGTPYVNTISTSAQAPFAGDYDMERRIKSYMRWNAMAMVVN